MHRTLVRLLVMLLLWSSAAYAKNKEAVEPLPLFMDPDFHFSQVDTVCLAPTLDLRSDRSVPIPSPSELMIKDLLNLGYATLDCKAVNATRNDLSKPSDTWLHGLDFGSTKWLLVSAVEEVSVNASTFKGTEGGMEGGHAVVSGYLFAKQGDAAKLVWRDRTFGIPRHLGVMVGAKSKVKATESRDSVDNAVRNLIGRFEQRSDKHPWVLFAVAEENVDTACSTIWPALKGALGKDPKKYKVAFLGDVDRMGLYTTWTRKLGREGNEDHVVLKDHGGTCVMQFTQAFIINEHRRTDDWSELIREVRASTSPAKQ